MVSRRTLAGFAAALAAIGAAAIGGACGPSADNVPVLRPDGGCLPGYGCTDGGLTLDSGPITIPPEPLEDWDASADGPLSGIFAVEATVTAQAGVTVTSKQLYRLRIAQSGTHIHQKTTLCDLSLPSTNIATLAIPPALRDIIQSRSVENDGDFLSNASVIGAQYLPPQFVEVLGANLANPATDPLPTMDAGAWTDDDGDGFPGVTLVAQVVTCSSLQNLYVALRATGVLAGTVETPDLIKGFAQIHLNESVLGYSDPCLAAAAQISIVVEPDSPFRAQRVGAAEDVDHNGNVSCPEIQITAPSIFADWSK
jgi:hypothetical protein